MVAYYYFDSVEPTYEIFLFVDTFPDCDVSFRHLEVKNVECFKYFSVCIDTFVNGC